MLSRSESLLLCETVLAHAKAAGAEDVVVSVESTIAAHARLADSRFTTSGRAEDLSITVTVWIERRRGAASGNDASAPALEQLAREAVQIARISPVHREYVPTLGPLEYQESKGFSDATADVDVAARAKALRAVLDACGTAGVSGAGVHTANASAIAVATANGNRRYFRSSEGTFSLTARSADGTGSGYCAGDHFDVRRVDPARIATVAVDKAVTSQAARPIEPGTYAVVLEAQAVADLMGFVVGALDARTADEGRSAFSAADGKTRVGEALFHPSLSIHSDPMHPEMPAVPATDEGIPAERITLVKDGVLERLAYNRYWATERKQTPTPGPVNFIVESAKPTPMEGLIGGLERGLLISRFWYVRLVDPRTIVLTGLTRDGVWWVEDGRVKHPVRNLRFNQGMLAMLAPWNVQAIGASVRRSPFMVPPLRLAGFTFTSISDAI